MMFDPWYWAVMGAAMLLSFWASSRVKSTFAKYSQFVTRSGLTGADVARRILSDSGIHDVRVERVAGNLSDHYDPTQKVLRLSEPVHDSRTMAAFGVAAHEVGHAIQHATGYAPLKFRSAWVPVASIGSNLGIWIVFASVMLGAARGASGFPLILGIIGLLLFAGTTVFTLITLPVEFDASKRAIACLERGGYTTSEELEGARKVLDAAAMTYVAAAAASLMTLAYWAVLILGGRRD